ncbi:MAG: hypothetical protein ACI9NN_002102 [Bacteroidia bacterium]|jgi:hypothetical protein
MYIELGGKIFGEKRDWWKPWETWKFLQASYDYKSLENSLRDIFGDAKLGGS